MIERDTIQARREALAERMAQATEQYEELERALKQLDRQLCAMAGGLQELDALLEEKAENDRDYLSC